MKKIFSIMILLSWLWAMPTLAHVLDINSTIGAVLHMDPEDDPIIGQPTKFYLEFKDKENKFKLAHCDCTLSIHLGNKEIFKVKSSDPAVSSSAEALSFSAILPEAGDYELSIQGVSRDESFKAFDLDYKIHAERLSEKTPSELQKFFAGHTWHLVLFIAGALVCVVLVLRDKRKESRNRTQA